MNYIEWALQRGAELWRAREEALKKRLSLVPEGTAQKKAAEAQLSEEEAAAQDAEMSGGERCASAREGGRERGQCVRLDKKAPERGRPRRGERGGSAREK